MALGCLSLLALFGAAIVAGLGYFSFWWLLIPAFVAGSFALSNGPQYGAIVRANEEGRLGVFPMALGGTVGMSLAVSAVIYWITRLIAGT
jgi:hypothetical protein